MPCLICVLVHSSLFTRLLSLFILAIVLHFQGSEQIDFENPIYGVHGHPNSDGTVNRRGSNKVFYQYMCIYLYIYVLFLAPLSQCWANVVVVVNYKNCHFLQYLRRRCSVYT